MAGTSTGWQKVSPVKSTTISYGNVTPTDSSGLSAPVIKNADGSYWGGVSTGGSSSVPAPVTNQNAFSGMFGKVQTPSQQNNVMAVASPTYSQSALSVPQSASVPGLVGVRNGFENNGYKVDWKPATESVVLTNPNGVSTTLNKGDYQNQDGSAYIPQDKFLSILGSKQQPQTQQQSNVVPAPVGLNQPLSYDQIQKQVQDKINFQIQQRQNQAQAQIQAYQNAFNNQMQTLRDNRVLENLQFDRNNNPFSGGSDYRKAMLDRQREISDAQSQQQLQSQVGQINMGLQDYSNQLQSTADSQVRDLINQERDYSLKEQQFGLQKDQFDWQKQYQSGELGIQQQKAKVDAIQNQLKFAIDKLDKVGYATQDVADLLGVPVGTPSFEAKKAAAQMQLDASKLQETKDYHGQEIGVRQKEIELRTASDAVEKNYKQSLIDKGISEQHAKTATNAATAAILNSSSYEQGLNAIYQKRDELTADGVNVADVMKALDNKFPKDSYGDRSGN